MYLNISMFMAGVCKGQKRAGGSQELESQVAVSHHSGAETSGRALNQSATSPDPSIFFVVLVLKQGLIDF